MNNKNVFLEKISDDELQQIRGGAWACDEKMPRHIKKANLSGKPSSVYQAWLFAHCTSVSSCQPSTWNHCY